MNARRFLEARWAFLVPLVLLIAFFWSAGPIDDDYICFRYGRNWANGLGLVYNQGERIEGYSQPLWVLICCACEWCGFVPELATKLIGTASITFALFLVSKRSSGMAFLLACLPALGFHAVAGLGTTTFAALLAGAVATWSWRDEKGWRALVPWAFLGVAGLARGEGLLFVLPATAWRLRERLDPRVLVGWSGYVAWQLVRVFYYERWIPVTWDVKKLPFLADLEFGASYLLMGGWSSGYLLLIAALCWLVWGKKLKRPLVPFAIGTFLHLGFVVYVGGDFVQFGRFWVPVVPLVGYLIVCSERPTASVRRFGFGALVLAAALVRAWPEGVTVFDKARAETARWVSIGKELDRRLPERARVGTSPIGAIGYYGRRGLVDLLGLTNDKILHSPPDLSIPLKGHQRTNPVWVLRVRPEVLVLGNGRSFQNEQGRFDLVVSQWERSLVADPRFGALYRQIAMPMPGQEPLLLFVRSDATDLIRDLGR